MQFNMQLNYLFIKQYQIFNIKKYNLQHIIVVS